MVHRNVPHIPVNSERISPTSNGGQSAGRRVCGSLRLQSVEDLVNDLGVGAGVGDDETHWIADLASKATIKIHLCIWIRHAMQLRNVEVQHLAPHVCLSESFLDNSRAFMCHVIQYIEQL